jgi:uncharacterized protein with von Willebrand factor type A (vWA) domain
MGRQARAGHIMGKGGAMDSKDLLALLDLKGESTVSLPPAVAIAPTVEPAPAAASPTALRVDAWGLRRGRDLVAESDRLKALDTDAFAAADFFGAAFDPEPILLNVCATPLRREFLAHMFETPAYHKLHAATRLDDTASTIAAAHFAEEYSRLGRDLAAGATDAGEHEMAVLRAAGRAVKNAGSEVGEMREATSALGLGAGCPGRNDPQRIAELFRRVRSDATLRRICDLAGRFRRVAQGRQRRKVRHGLDDIVGIEMSNEISRLLPVELSRLVDPDLELDALRRLAEAQSLCREHHSLEPVGKGPIICVVDESSSMDGEKCHTAKALALTLAWIARQQRRWCGLVAYSGDSGERLLALPPARWDETALCDWLSAFIGCGSTLDVPVREMPEFYRRLGAPPGVTDVIFVTDAQCRIPAPDCAAFVQWKRSVQARLHSLVLDNPPGDLATISDEVHAVTSLAAESEAVGRVLSL